MAQEISSKIKKELLFTVNIGLSDNKILAKMASDFEKPDKIHTLYKEEIQSKIWHLPIEELFMVGKQSAIKLRNIAASSLIFLTFLSSCTFAESTLSNEPNLLISS